MNSQTVIDKQAIKDLQVAYSLTIDSGRYEDLDEVFTPDVVADYGHAGRHQGIASIQDACRVALDSLDGVQHLNGNHWAEIDDDRASAGCYFTVHQFRKDTPGGDHYRMGGRYDDELVRTADGWRITRRSLVVLWADGNPDVRFVR
jgi:hypothetical protein